MCGVSLKTDKRASLIINIYVHVVKLAAFMNEVNALVRAVPDVIALACDTLAIVEVVAIYRDKESAWQRPLKYPFDWRGP